MVCIIKQKINGKDYYYLRKSVREGKKVLSKHIAYLGPDKKEAELKAREIIKNLNKKDNFMENKINEKKLETEKEIKEKVQVGNKLDEINKIASNKGFFFQTAGLYGGAAGFYTYGHLGKALKSNWEKLWRENIVSLGENFYEIQSNNILPEEVFKASGHIENFNDPMIECKKCSLRFRADQFLEDYGIKDSETLTIEQINSEIKKRNLKCSKCGGEISDAKQFNMMFSVNVGFNEEKSYLSPETAQGAYITFLEEFKATRGKLPLGLAIIDKAYRNEISPRQMFFRLREFSQAELQIFFDPDKIDEHEKWNEVKNKKLRIKFSKKKEIEEINCTEINEKLKLPKFYLYYALKVQEFYLNVLGIPKEKFRFRELSKEERAFYNKIHFDVEVDLDTLGGFKEVAGVHYRTDHDLKGHEKISGKNLEIFDELSKKKILPHVLELSFGVDRNIWALLDVFYSIGKEGSMFKFPAKFAPIKAAIFPIVKNEKMVEIAKDICDDLKKDFNIIYDEGGSVGRRYARNDEIGTPFCITVDGDSLKKKDVTIRDRDT
ncbi:MAG: glycine--tRNA ligase, partial [Candidatus Diapherotrites archaeon]